MHGVSVTMAISHIDDMQRFAPATKPATYGVKYDRRYRSKCCAVRCDSCRGQSRFPTIGLHLSQSPPMRCRHSLRLRLT